MIDGLFIILIPFSLYLTDLKTQIVPRSKHSKPWLEKTDTLMLYNEIIAVFFSDSCRTHKCIAGKEQNFCPLKLVLCKVTFRF